MSLTLDPAQSPAPAPRPSVNNPGCVDFVTHCPKLGGWLAGGWIALGWDDSDAPPDCTLQFADGVVSGAAPLCLFPREDVRKLGTGFVLFLADETTRGHRDLLELRLRRPGHDVRLPPSVKLHKPSEADAITRTKTQLAASARTAQRASLLNLITRPAFTGQDTLNTLGADVFVETDAAILCPPGGLLLRGWFADPFRRVASLRVRCGSQSVLLDPQKWVSIARPDVCESLAKQHANIAERCGFMVFVPGIYASNAVCAYEVETRSGEVVFKKIPAIRSPGLPAIKEALSVFDLRYQEMINAFEHVVGPAVGSMNAFRLEVPPAVTVMAFGKPHPEPSCSIIVPLYGRIDFMEYQMAIFARTLGEDVEIIFVLDDPPRLNATERLASACHARFGRAFQLLCLDRNLGYAPANNIGLKHARAPYVCLLNSDVFPKAPNWLTHMLETAQSDPRVGVVGALLLFEDETIQHEGCTYEALREFGGWRFPLHKNKGRAVSADESVREVEAVTGACLVMRTDLARDVGGLDEGYVIGDFEDVDLCCKVQARGLTCVVDRRARLYHLERQSQNGNNGAQNATWRLNLTLFNAWRFQSRWPRPGQAALAGEQLG
jgi:GT2 family glycosyltransferase